MLPKTNNDKNNTEITQEIITNIKKVLTINTNYFNTYFNTVLSCYLLYKYNPKNITNDKNISYKDIIDNNELKLDEDIMYCLKVFLNKDIWNELKKLSKLYSKEQLSEAILRCDKFFKINIMDNSYPSPTPNSIIELSKKILNIQQNEKVADFCCGQANFLISAFKDTKKANYYGYDLNINNKVIAIIKSEIVKAKISISIKDVFELDDEKNLKFDKIFCDHPFGMYIHENSRAFHYKNNLLFKYKDYFNLKTSEWFFNKLICDKLSKDGKAISFVLSRDGQTNSLLNTRKFFIEHGYIESAITLPNNLFPYTSMSLIMLVFSQNNNKGVRIVDATNIYKKSQDRTVIFDCEQIEEIINSLSKDNEFSKFVSNKELEKNEYILNLYCYKNDFTLKNSVPFESVILNIKRGINISRDEQDKLFSKEPTDYKYLTITNYSNGLIEYNNLQSLKSINQKLEKYCIKDNSLIISRTGTIDKIAVAAVKDNQKIVASGNLFSIELDTKKINPYYIMSFFMSYKGKTLLKKISYGSVITMLPIDALKKLNIPLPSLDKQDEIVKKFRALIDEIEIEKIKIEKATEKLHMIFDEGC